MRRELRFFDVEAGPFHVDVKAAPKTRYYFEGLGRFRAFINTTFKWTHFVRGWRGQAKGGR